MRMINADTLKQSVTTEMMKVEINSPMYYTLECVIADIDNQPTAFDLDKVVEQLQGEVKQSEYYAQNFEDNGMYLESEQETKVKVALERVIENVKKGGTA